MKKYYAERHGLLTKQLQIDFDELLQYFRQVINIFVIKSISKWLQGECGDKFLIRRIRSRFYHQVCCRRQKCILQHAYRIKRFGRFGNISKNMMNRLIISYVRIKRGIILKQQMDL